MAEGLRLSRIGALVAPWIVACAGGGSPAGPGLPPGSEGPESWDGAAVYAEQCASCHGDAGEGGLGPAVYSWADGRDALVANIDETMPYVDPSECRTGGCAEAVADYVLGLDGVVLCDDPPLPARRLRLLTRREYAATVRDLLAPLGGMRETGPDPCTDGTTFTYDAGGRSLGSVHVAGSFNGWDPAAWPMRAEGGVWTLTRVVPEGRHEYKLVLDGGEWITDPANPETAPDGFGGANSVLEVACAGGGEPGGAVAIADLTRAMPVETRPEAFPFDNAADPAVVTSVHAQEYLSAAKRVADAVGARVVELVPCEGDDAGCAEQFVRTFGRRAFRRPLTDEERARYGALATGEASRAEGWQVALHGLLASPHFLYRSEVGEAHEGAFRLTGWELAAGLSYGLLGTTPGDALLDAAAAGELDDAEGVGRWVDRLLANEGAREQLGVFARQWLGVEGLGELTRGLDPALRADLVEETERFVAEVAFGGGRFRDLLTADWTVANDRVAAHYGLEGPGDWGRVTLPEERRAGVLGHASLHVRYAHSDQSSPIQRGTFLRRRLLCQDFPPPPPEAGGVPDVDPTATTRERFRQHTENPRCYSCHQYIDDLGFGFERFDQDGRYRDVENGQPIDPSGVLRDVEGFGTDTEAPFASLPELGARLAESEAAPDCFARQVWRFAHGALESDACMVRELEERFRASEGDIGALLREVYASERFRLRQTPGAGETGESE